MVLMKNFSILETIQTEPISSQVIIGDFLLWEILLTDFTVISLLKTHTHTTLLKTSVFVHTLKLEQYRKDHMAPAHRWHGNL